MITFRARLVLAGLAALAMIGVACSNGSSTSTPAASGGTDTGVCQSVDTTGDALASVCESGKLRVATDQKYKPQSWFDVKTQQWMGFDVDVANEIATRLGVTADINHQDWSTVTAGSWNDRWDVNVGSMTDTVDREELFNFTPSYYYTPAAVAVNVDNTTIQDISTDLDGKTVCVGVDTTYQYYLDGSLVLGSTAPPFDFLVDGAKIVTYNTDTDALDQLDLGDGVRCDAAITAAPTIATFVADGGKVKQVGAPLYYEPLSVALDKNDPVDNATLTHAISKIVTDMHDDGTLSSLSMKWYGTDLTTSAAGEPSSSP
ncbi:MAG: transporter substrate-binding domain-containing protein [Actinomycetota bacterium]